MELLARADATAGNSFKRPTNQLVVQDVGRMLRVRARQVCLPRCADRLRHIDPAFNKGEMPASWLVSSVQASTHPVEGSMRQEFSQTTEDVLQRGEVNQSVEEF
jgi:hypothetical protein